MKSKEELQPIIDKIASADSPVGMDAVYVHALILDQLRTMSERIEQLDKAVETIGKVLMTFDVLTISTKATARFELIDHRQSRCDR